MYSNKDYMVLPQGQTHRSMEKSSEPTNGFTQIYPTDFSQRCKSNSTKEIEPLQHMAMEQLDIYTQKHKP